MVRSVLAPPPRASPAHVAPLVRAPLRFAKGAFSLAALRWLVGQFWRLPSPCIPCGFAALARVPLASRRGRKVVICLGLLGRLR